MDAFLIDAVRTPFGRHRGGPASLRPAFSAGGTVTAGNASPVNHGAIAVLVGSAATVAAPGVDPLGRVVASVTVAVEPHRFSVGPVPAIRKVLARAGLRFGASAPRVIIDACRELRRRGGGSAVAAACIGVGQGTALVLRVD